MPLSNLAIRDIETLAHPNTNLAQLRETGPLVIERGKGVYVYDSDGKPYLEGMAGLWCTALGYGNEELAETAAAEMKKLGFSHLYNGKSHDPAIELAERLKEMAPVPISKVFFCNSGSEANDTQIKLVRYMNNALGRPAKKKIIGRLKGFHGLTIGAASLTGLPHNHADFDLPIPGILHVSCPHH
jgi:4-aminobutyrate---pyruvate transaminase